MKQKITYISYCMSIVNDGIFCTRYTHKSMLALSHPSNDSGFQMHSYQLFARLYCSDIAKSDWKRMLWIYWMIWHSQINQMDSSRIQQTDSNRSKLENCQMIDRKMCLVHYTIQTIQSRTKSTKAAKKNSFFFD